MNLNDIKKSCEIEASIVKVTVPDENGNMVQRPYNSLSDAERKANIRYIKRELANKYCDYDEVSVFSKDPAEREDAERYKSAYWAAVLLCYWAKIFDWMMTSGSLGLRETDFFDWLTEAVHDAFYYRSWRPRRRIKPNDPKSGWFDNPQYKPEEADAADKSINFFCGAKRAKEYQAANKYKRKSNYQNLSIDQSFDEDGYCILDRAGLSTDGINGMGIKGLVHQLLNENKLLEAVIVDSIANGDSFKQTRTKIVNKVVDEEGNEEEEKLYKYSNDFNARKLVKFLTSLDENYFKNYFDKTYNIKEDNSNQILSKLKSLTNNRLYKEIEKTILIVKNRPELLGFLM